MQPSSSSSYAVLEPTAQFYQHSVLDLTTSVRVGTFSYELYKKLKKNILDNSDAPHASHPDGHRHPLSPSNTSTSPIKHWEQTPKPIMRVEK